MGAFQNGFAIGQKMVDDIDQQQRAREELKMRQERNDAEIAQMREQTTGLQRTNRLNSQVDEANSGLSSYLANGTMTGNNSGYSDASAGLYFNQGGSPAVDAAASYDNHEARRMGLDTPYQTGGVTARAYDPSNLDDQAGLNRRLMGVAALKGDYGTLTTLQQKNAELADTKVFNQGAKQFLTNPDSFAELTRYVNKSNPMLTAAPAKDPRTGQLTGYNIMTVGPSGDATHKFLSPQETAQLAGAVALMQQNPTKALQIMATVDQGVAAAVAASNTAMEKSSTTNNNATHFANEDYVGRENAQSARITASAHAGMAAAAQSRANRENMTKPQQMKEEANAYADILQKKDPSLTREDAMKQAYDLVLKNPNVKDQPDVGLPEAGIFRKNGKYYRLGKGGQPEEVKFPGESATDKALKDLASKGADPFAGAPNPKRPIVLRDDRASLTAPGQAMVGDPAAFQRVAKQGLMGGISYVYKDPLTGREFSTDQYNELLSGK
jgi:hypothetical protein